MKFFIAFIALVVVAQAKECPFSSKFNKLSSSSKGDCPHLKSQQATARPPDTTAMGCTCKGVCGATIDDKYDCDWCYVADECGRSGLKGKWDYCVYPQNKEYEYQKWDQKLSGLWSQIDADHTSGPVASVLGLFKTSIQTSFDDHSDMMPAGRTKRIHSVGAVCKFNLKISGDSPFTGVFKANNVAHGLIRMGSALAVDESSGVVPGLGIKFLRSGVPSGNFVALVSLGPLPDKSYNFFEKTFSNHIPPATGVAAILGKKFNQKSNCITQVGLSDICKYDNDGHETDKIAFPFQVTLDSRIIQFPVDPVKQDKLQEMLAAIPSGTDLFEIGYFADPKAAKSGQKPTVLGTMTTDGPCVNSAFGDGSLFFKHQLVEEDWELEPTWPGYLDPSVDCSYSGSKLPKELPKQCQAKFAEKTKEVKTEQV